MEIIAPDYYGEFECLKGDCAHSCCAGWEIDVDDETLSWYSALPEDEREWVTEKIDYSSDPPHFHLTEEERCPFLRSDGLCEMIIRLGTDALCDICLDHPLFRNEYGDRMEIGFGLCCEAACRLAIGREEKLSFICAGDGADEELLPVRHEMIGLAQNRDFTIAERIGEIERLCGIESSNVTALAEFMQSLEMLDPHWGQLLSAAASGGPAFPGGLDVPLEQLLVYLIYRHSQRPPAFACAMFRLCAAVAAASPEEDFLELCRLFSSEIEYSDENPERIMEYLTI